MRRRRKLEAPQGARGALATETGRKLHQHVLKRSDIPAGGGTPVPSFHGDVECPVDSGFQCPSDPHALKKANLAETETHAICDTQNVWHRGGDGCAGGELSCSKRTEHVEERTTTVGLEGAAKTTAVTCLLQRDDIRPRSSQQIIFRAKILPHIRLM